MANIRRFCVWFRTYWRQWMAPAGIAAIVSIFYCGWRWHTDSEDRSFRDHIETISVIQHHGGHLDSVLRQVVPPIVAEQVAEQLKPMAAKIDSTSAEVRDIERGQRDMLSYLMRRNTATSAIQLSQTDK